ncbi:MAG: J domain-containing protein [Chloroflexota bacterium]|nr:J domain-containing protein [Chloroflexota bacterium]
MEDLYAVLGVAASASAAEIHAAFRRLAMVHHPDRPTGSRERMAAINRAYAVLSDPRRRRQYDQQRLAPAPLASAPPTVPPAEAPPWQIDLEQGRDMQAWQQMYAEERHTWEQLLRAQADHHPGRSALLQALERARAEQLALENAIRRKAGQAPLSVAEFERARSALEHERRAAAVRAGCSTFWISWLPR